MDISGTDVFDVPAKGGAYDFKADYKIVQYVKIYEDMPFLSHDRSNYFLKQDEFFTYQRLIKLRGTEDAKADLSQLINYEQTSVGVLSDYNPANLETFTYTFPANLTGKYRLICMEIGNDPQNTDGYFFIQTPN